MLERIQKANDIKNLKKEELPILAEEIREFLVETVSKTGGHLASNLGVIELTMAMHLVFQMPEDKIIWDVGHQSYTHKILTGRKDGFENLRKYGGMSGFPKRKESDCDAFDTGHSSTSISAGLGYVRARDLKGEDYSVISVIGDGSMTGGMAFEALNNASQLNSNFIIVLNDNHMSISENVGGMSRYLAKIRTADFYTGLKKGVTTTLEKIPKVGDSLIEQIRRTKSSIKQLIVPGMFFEDMGITYLGPVKGHDLPTLCRVFSEARRIEGPVLVHVLTKKGKGYTPAEEHPGKFHGISPFDIATGEVSEKKKKAGSAYDQIIHDVGLQKLPVVFAVDRAGLVGSDGETHQGIFDLSFLSSIPNMTVMSPKHKWELADMLRFALKSDGPVAIRYPRGAAYDQYVEYRAPIEYCKSEMICEESGIALISMGHMFEEAVKVRKNLKDAGYSCTLVNGRFVKPIDEECIARLAKNHKLIVVLEENVITGGYGMQVLECAARKQLSCHVLPIALPDNYVEHGSVEVLRKETGIDAQSVTEKIMETYKELQI